LLKKAGVLKNGENEDKWGFGKKADTSHLKMGSSTFYTKGGFDKSNPYTKTGRQEEEKCFIF
jgi:hypothetical protein